MWQSAVDFLLFKFLKVKWLQLTGAMGKSKSFRCRIFSQFQHIIKIRSFLVTKLFKNKNKKIDCFFGTQCSTERILLTTISFVREIFAVVFAVTNP